MLGSISRDDKYGLIATYCTIATVYRWQCIYEKDGMASSCTIDERGEHLFNYFELGCRAQPPQVANSIPLINSNSGGWGNSTTGKEWN